MKKLSGAILVSVLTALAIFILFHSIIREPNKISFAGAGDGLKSTYGTLYHLKYDSTYWHTNMMNYPYGESVFFTGNQVFLTNILKFIKNHGPDLSDYALGISNILILFSYVLCALFLYLIFTELGIPPGFSILFAFLLTFLTPQWDRLTGHYNLAYAYAFPAAIYLAMVFYRRPRFLLSVVIGLYLFFMCWKHLYFYVLIGILFCCFWIYVLITEPQKFGGVLRSLTHIVIQLLLPLIIFTLFSNMYDVNGDRTAYPWGFIQSTTRLVSVFLPLQHPYFHFMKVPGPWKTVAYVGAIAALTFIFILFRMILHVSWKRSFRHFFRITEYRILNILFWGSVISFLVSLGLPFSLGLEKWLNYAGPFRQFRAIGRFVFPFFYMLNILTFYLIWRYLATSARLWMRILFVLALILTGFDAWRNISPYPQMLNHKIATLNDRDNTLPEDQWVSRYDWNDFQAILPLPYFHVGSENYWYGGNSPVQVDAYVASLKTGLPLNAVMMSRTSISQTLNNLDIFFEPYKGYPVLSDLPSMKPFLIVYLRKSHLNPAEENLIRHAVFLTENENLAFYRFLPDSLKVLPGERQKELMKMIPGCVDADSSREVIYENFDDTPEGIYQAEITKPSTFYETAIHDTGNYKVSFWAFDGDRDLYPRTRIIVSLSLPGEKNYFYYNMDLQRRIVLRDGSKILFEDTFPVKYPGTIMRLKYDNKVLTRGLFRIDDLLIRNEDENVRFIKDDHTWVNNREIFARDYCIPSSRNFQKKVIPN